MKLWDKGGASDADVLAYTARDDHTLDRALLPYDLLASKAHVRGLCRVGALDPGERDRIVEGLEAIEAELAAGRFEISPEMEDGHTAIESFLVARLGDTGKRVHLGRSRNDQVLTAMRLYLRDALGRVARHEVAASRAMIAFAKARGSALMPGYTHLQRAVPQNLGHWALAYANGFAESVRAVLSARAQCDRSPLGAAAGYGVNLPLDREGVAHEMGFAGVDINPLWSQSSRGISEVFALSAVWHGMAVVRRFAWDLSLFSTSEFAFFKLPAEFTTGSSIMPNKRNPDVVELMRASTSVVEGAIAELMSLVSLPSGYHRDLQLTKAPTMRALAEASSTLSLVPKLVASLEIDEERMRAAITRDMLATDAAVDLARAGMPFRDAYKRIARDLGDTAVADRSAVEASVRARVSYGAPGNLATGEIERMLEELVNQLQTPS